MYIERASQRPTGSLQDRLLAMARLARQKAASCPAGPERDALLRKAEQTERTAGGRLRAKTRLCIATQALAHLTNIPSSDGRSIVRPHQHSI